MIADDQSARRVEYLPLSELEPDPRNPKSHDLDTIDSSIGRFGVLDSIVRDDRTGYIISGHGRRSALAAMKDRGETAPEGVEMRDGGEWLVPVVTGWASRSDTEAHAALIALNRTTELGGWVDESLLGLLEELEQEGPEAFDGVGFDESAIGDLRRVMASYEASYGDPSQGVDTDEGGVDPDDGDEIGSVDLLDEDYVIVKVAVAEEDRPKLYSVLHDLDYVIDARDGTGR